MGLIARIGQWFNSRPNEITTSQELDRWIRFGGEGTGSGVNVTVENAQGLPAVASAVRVLSEAVAHLPLVLYRRDGSNREPARDLPLFRLLHDSPNAWQTSYQWRKLQMRDLLFRGNAYSLISGTPQVPASLTRLHPDKVEPKQASDGTVTFEYKRDNERTVVLSAEQVLHVWFDSDDGITGISPIQAFRESIGDGLAIRQHGSKFFSNSARVSGLLKLTEGTKIGQEARDQLLEDFDSMYGGNENAHKTAMLPGGVDFEKVSLSMADAQWIEAKKWTAREIYGMFGIPPHKAGDLADATFSNIEQENLSFVIDALMPRLVAWEQAINKRLLDNDPGFFVKFNTSALLRGDFKSRQEGLQIQRRNGAISANEWRQLEDMNQRDDDGGDRYIVEQNMQDDTQPLGQQNESNQTPERTETRSAD